MYTWKYYFGCCLPRKSYLNVDSKVWTLKKLLNKRKDRNVIWGMKKCWRIRLKKLVKIGWTNKKKEIKVGLWSSNRCERIKKKIKNAHYIWVWRGWRSVLCMKIWRFDLNTASTRCLDCHPSCFSFWLRFHFFFVLIPIGPAMRCGSQPVIEREIE